MKKTTREFTVHAEVGRDRPSYKYQGPLGSGEGHGTEPPAQANPAAVFGVVMLIMFALGGIIVMISAAVR